MTNETLPGVLPANKQETVLFHSAYGLRPGVLQWADRLRHIGTRCIRPTCTTERFLATE